MVVPGAGIALIQEINSIMPGFERVPHFFGASVVVCAP